MPVKPSKESAEAGFSLPEIVRRRFWIVLLCLGVCLLAGAISALTARGIYVAVSTLQHQGDADTGTAELGQAYASVVKHPEMARKVISDLPKATRAALPEKLLGPVEGAIEPNAIAAALAESADVSVTADRFLYLNIRSDDARLAAELSNAYAKALVDMQAVTSSAADENTRRWWRSRFIDLENKRDRLGKTRKDLLLKMGPETDEGEAVLPKLGAPTQKYVRARVEAYLLKEEYELARKAEAQGKSYLAFLLQGEAAAADPVEALKTRADTARQRSQELGEGLQVLEMRLSAGENDLLRLAEINGKISGLEERIATFRGRLNSGRMLGNLPGGSLSIASPASIPEASVKPVWRRALGLSLLFGTLAGLIMAVVLELVSARSVVSPLQQWRAQSDRPVLGPLTLLRSGAGPEQLLDKPGDALAQPVGEVASAVERLRASDGSLMIMITSAARGEGKTVLAGNLATTMARSAPTLLVDMHLAQPGLNTMGNKQGLTDFLSGQCETSEFMASPEAAPGLKVISAGSTPVENREFLGSMRMSEFRNQVRKRFDSVVLDTGPFDSEGTVYGDFARHVDAVLVAFDPDQTDYAAVDGLCRQIESRGGRVAAVVLSGRLSDAA